MGKIVKRVFTLLLLPAAIVALVYMNFDSISQPVRFEEEKAMRQGVAIQRLEDIRTLQVEYNRVYGKYASTVDSLIIFYNEGEMTVTRNVGNMDDSLAVVNTEVLKKKLKTRGIKDSDMQQALYAEYEKDTTLRIVCSVPRKFAVKSELFVDREDFCVDSLAFIPFSGGDRVIMEAAISEAQGVKLPLFEARMPFQSLLKGMDPQFVSNLVHEKRDLELYEGLKVGDVKKANNNAGNWE